MNTLHHKNSFPPTAATRHRCDISITSAGVPITLSIWHRHPDAGTILFYPGTMASPLMYTLLLEELWAQGFNVAGLHLLSHGHSPRIKKDFTFTDLLQNGLDAARFLRETFPGALAVTGHSQGGILTLAHAIRDPHIAVALPMCLLLPQQNGAEEVTLFRRFARHRDTILRALDTAARLFPRLPVSLPCYLNIARAMAHARATLAPRRYLRWSYPLCFISSLFHADLSAACEPGQITSPLALLTARDDALFPLPLMRAMLDTIHAPQKSLVIVPGGGHMFPLSRVYIPYVAALIAARCVGYGVKADFPPPPPRKN